MKKSFYLFFIALIAVGFTSCKKCQTCTDCGVLNAEYCEEDFDDKEDYNAWIDDLEDNGCDCK